MQDVRQKRGAVNTFRLQARGLGRVLGSLEAEVMECSWASEAPLRLRDILRVLAADRPLSFNTVVSVVNHLVDKGLLHARRLGRGQVVWPALSRDAFVAQVSRDVSAGLIRDFGELAVAQFVAALRDEDPEALERLADVLRREEGDGHATE